MDQIALSQLNALWHALENVVTTDDDGETVISDPFLHFPSGTPRLPIWTWFEAMNEHFSVANALYGTPLPIAKTSISRLNTAVTFKKRNIS